MNAKCFHLAQYRIYLFFLFFQLFLFDIFFVLVYPMSFRSDFYLYTVNDKNRKTKKKTKICTVRVFFSLFRIVIFCSLSEYGFAYVLLFFTIEYFWFSSTFKKKEINEKKFSMYYFISFYCFLFLFLTFFVLFFFCVYFRSNLMMWQSITNEWPLNTGQSLFFLCVCVLFICKW